VGRSPHVFVLFLEQDAAPDNTKIFGERELPYVSVKTELASGSVGGKVLFRYANASGRIASRLIERLNGGQTGEMDGDDQKRKPRIKQGELDVHT
jgi:hypothetical protein